MTKAKKLREMFNKDGVIRIAGAHDGKMRHMLYNLRITMAHKGSIHSYYLEKHIREFSLKMDNNFPLILDIGSGNKPYKSIFRFRKYVAIDI